MLTPTISVCVANDHATSFDVARGNLAAEPNAFASPRNRMQNSEGERGTGMNSN